MAAGVVLGGAGLSAAAAEALPGHSSHPTSAQTGSAGTAPAPTPGTAPSAATAGGATAGDGSGSSGGASITPPTQAPQPVYTPPVVNSGGS